MNSKIKTARVLEDVKVNVKWKISALWVATMFLFIYVDYFGLFVPGVMEKIVEGEVAHTGIQITQVFLLGSAILMMVPAVMIFLSLVLKPKVNRWANITVGILYAGFVIVFMIGDGWAYYYFYSIVEIVMILLIVWNALKWPKQEA